MKDKDLYNKQLSEFREEDYREIRKTIKRIPAKNAAGNADNRKKSGLIVLCCVLSVFVICLVVGVMLFAGGDRDITYSTNETNNLLAGTWSYDEVTVYTFDGDGHGTLQLPLSTYEFDYVIEGDTVTLNFADESVEDRRYSYTLSGDVLILTSIDGVEYRFFKIE